MGFFYGDEKTRRDGHLRPLCGNGSSLNVAEGLDRSEVGCFAFFAHIISVVSALRPDAPCGKAMSCARAAAGNRGAVLVTATP